jgi:hypothetical protein
MKRHEFTNRPGVFVRTADLDRALPELLRRGLVRADQVEWVRQSLRGYPVRHTATAYHLTEAGRALAERVGHEPRADIEPEKFGDGR